MYLHYYVDVVNWFRKTLFAANPSRPVIVQNGMNSTILLALRTFIFMLNVCSTNLRVQRILELIFFKLLYYLF